MDDATFESVSAPDEQSREAVVSALAQLQPMGAGIGRLTEVAAWLAACQGQVPAAALQRCRAVVFAGDHGVARLGVSSLPLELSVQRAEALLVGDGVANVAAREAGASIRVVDVSLDHDAWGEERVSRSSGSIDREDAMSPEQFARALEIGRRVADEEIDGGADLLIPGDLGVATTTVAAAVMGAFTRTEPVAIVGPGVGVSDEMWKVKVAAIRDAMFRVRGQVSTPLDTLRMISSPDFVALVAFIAQAAARRTPMLLDGALVTAAAYVAEMLAPGVRGWLWAGQLTPEPSQLIALQAMDLTPLLALDMTAGQATGALTALPLVKAAAEMVAEQLA